MLKSNLFGVCSVGFLYVGDRFYANGINLVLLAEYTDNTFYRCSVTHSKLFKQCLVFGIGDEVNVGVNVELHLVFADCEVVIATVNASHCDKLQLYKAVLVLNQSFIRVVLGSTPIGSTVFVTKRYACCFRRKPRLGNGRPCLAVVVGGKFVLSVVYLTYTANDNFRTNGEEFVYLVTVKSSCRVFAVEVGLVNIVAVALCVLHVQTTYAATALNCADNVSFDVHQVFALFLTTGKIFRICCKYKGRYRSFH